LRYIIAFIYPHHRHHAGIPGQEGPQRRAGGCDAPGLFQGGDPERGAVGTAVRTRRRLVERGEKVPGAGLLTTPALPPAGCPPFTSEEGCENRRGIKFGR